MSEKNKKVPVSRISTEYGEMLVLDKDTYQSDSLKNSGKARSWGEVDLLRDIVRKIDKPVFFDVGANLGSFTMGLAKTIKENGGLIYAFEPQRVVFNCLCGSVIINGYDNIFVDHNAVGDGKQESIETPRFDYSETCSFGSVEFGDRQNERLHQERREDGRKDFVKIVTLDSFIDKVEKVDLIKIDVEGMEESVLDGAKAMIGKHKPVLFIEHLKSDKSKMRKTIENLGYDDIMEVGLNFLCRQSNRVATTKPRLPDRNHKLL